MGGDLARTQDPADFLFVSGSGKAQAQALFSHPEDPPSGEWSWWDWVAYDREDFRPAVETLVSAGCEGSVLLDTLDLLRSCDLARSSPQELRRLGAELQRGQLALAELLSESPIDFEAREERLLLDYSPTEARAALRLLGDFVKQLEELEDDADRRRSRVQDQYRAILVRYVTRKTRTPKDRLVCDLLNGALSPLPELFDTGEDAFGRESHEPWNPITVEAHRRWRMLHKDLIDEPPKLEVQWREHLTQKAEERSQPRPQWLWSPDIHGTQRRNRRQTG